MKIKVFYSCPHGNHLPSPGTTSINIFHGTVLQTINLLNFCLSGNVSILPPFLKDILAGYMILVFFRIFKMLFFRFLFRIISGERSAITLCLPWTDRQQPMRQRLRAQRKDEPKPKAGSLWASTECKDPRKTDEGKKRGICLKRTEWKDRNRYRKYK